MCPPHLLMIKHYSRVILDIVVFNGSKLLRKIMHLMTGKKGGIQEPDKSHMKIHSCGRNIHCPRKILKWNIKMKLWLKGREKLQDIFILSQNACCIYSVIEKQNLVSFRNYFIFLIAMMIGIKLIVWCLILNLSKIIYWCQFTQYHQH